MVQKGSDFSKPETSNRRATGGQILSNDLNNASIQQTVEAKCDLVEKPPLIPGALLYQK